MMVAFKIMGADIGPRPNFVKPRSVNSDGRIPRCRYPAIAGAVLLDVGKAREWVMEALHTHSVRREHVIDLAPVDSGLGTVLIEERLPAGIASEQVRIVGDVRLDEHLVLA